MIFIYHINITPVTYMSLYHEGTEVTFETGTQFFTSNGSKPMHISENYLYLH